MRAPLQVSAACYPLHHPALVWAQLLAEAHVSRVKFAPLPWYRWHEKLGSEYVDYRRVRRGSQWLTLSRAHALLAVTDEHVWGKFSAYCRTMARLLSRSPPSPLCFDAPKRLSARLVI